MAEGFFKAPVRDVRNLPIFVGRTADRVVINAEGTLVELLQIRNAAGEPIKVSGLPAASFSGMPYLDHVQYQTLALSHESESEDFEFSGGNGCTARIDASGGQRTE